MIFSSVSILLQISHREYMALLISLYELLQSIVILAWFCVCHYALKLKSKLFIRYLFLFLVFFLVLFSSLFLISGSNGKMVERLVAFGRRVLLEDERSLFPNHEKIGLYRRRFHGHKSLSRISKHS